MPHTLFLRVRAMQIAVGFFLATTFLHGLIAFVVTGQLGESVFAPQLTVLTSVVLVFVSFCYLVVYNHNIALAIRTNKVLARIVESLNFAIAAFLQPQVVDSDTVFLVPSESSKADDSLDIAHRQCTTEGGVLPATTSGYMQRIDRTRIAKMAERHEAVVCLQFRPGEFVVEVKYLHLCFPRRKWLHHAHPAAFRLEHEGALDEQLRPHDQLSQLNALVQLEHLA